METNKTPSNPFFEKVQPFISLNSILTDLDSKANALADHFAKTPGSPPPTLFPQFVLLSLVLALSSSVQSPLNEPFTTGELDRSLVYLGNTAPGLDRVYNEHLKNLPDIYKRWLLNLCCSSLSTGDIPSCLDYAAPLHGTAAPSNLSKLNSIQNQCLYIATGCRKTIPITSLQIKADIPPLALLQEERACRYYCRLLQLRPNVATSELVQRMQFIPSHRGMSGNETADSAAKAAHLLRYRTLTPYSKKETLLVLHTPSTNCQVENKLVLNLSGLCEVSKVSTKEKDGVFYKSWTKKNETREVARNKPTQSTPHWTDKLVVVDLFKKSVGVSWSRLCGEEGFVLCPVCVVEGGAWANRDLDGVCSDGCDDGCMV
ncbi:hypothetical protein FHG87_009625 [Trinorchestia longiramus]|nr:hypothetical protein FHG87_009625 [Trinorchestia longiramus]